MSERLRYTGEHPVSFMTGSVGEVEPGGEFSVPDEAAARFLRRPDVERAAPAGQPQPAQVPPATVPPAAVQPPAR